MKYIYAFFAFFCGLSLAVSATALGQNSTVSSVNPWRIANEGYAKLASTTALLWVPGLASSDECIKTDASGKTYTGACGTGGGGGFAWTPTGYGVSTSTTLGFLNGFLSTASSTFTVLPSFPLTAGYTLRGSSGNTAEATSSLFVSAAGNVGIGNTSPAYPLDVTGAGRFTGLVDASHFVATSSTLASSFPYSSSTALTVSGTAFINALSSASAIPLTAGYTLRGGAGNTAEATSSLFVSASGNVGVGTTTPWKKLSVTGDFALTGGLFDSLASAGTNGMVLQSTGSATKWVATSTLGLGGSAGTVSSVDMTVPTGLSVSGNPITSAGTLALSLTAGYEIPLTASTTNWNTAYNWGNHASAGYLTGTVGVASGGTGATSFGQGWIYSAGGTGALAASTSPSVNYITATSTTVASTFPYASSTALSISGTSYLGTVASGVWNGTAIGDAYLTKSGDWTGTIDGNNFSGGAIGAGDMLYGSGAGTIAELGIGASSTIMTTDGTAPRWLTASALCVAITGSADLCDGSDASGGGGGNVATSTNETAGNLAYWTSSDATPATLGKVATTSVSCSGSVSCTTFSAIGSSPITISGTGGSSLSGWATSSTAWSQLILYPTNGTEDVAFGGTGAGATSTAPFWWDVSATTTYIGNGGAYDSFITLGPTSNEWTIGYDQTDSTFAISSSTVLGTNNQLTIAKGGAGTTTVPALTISSALSFLGDYITNATTWIRSKFSATYPVQISSGVISLAFGTTTSNIWASTQTFSAIAGAIDAGGATSFEIPNGSGPTVDATGEIALDTTSAQVKYYDGSAVQVLGNGYLYPSFTYSTTTAWAGTTTIPLGVAFVGETWSRVMCFTDAGTVNVSLYDGTNRMNLFNASTTVGTVTLSTNNTFTAAEKRYVDIGTPASSPTKISCTVRKAITAD